MNQTTKEKEKNHSLIHFEQMNNYINTNHCEILVGLFEAFGFSFWRQKRRHTHIVWACECLGYTSSRSARGSVPAELDLTWRAYPESSSAQQQRPLCFSTAGTGGLRPQITQSKRTPLFPHTRHYTAHLSRSAHASGRHPRPKSAWLKSYITRTGLVWSPTSLANFTLDSVCEILCLREQRDTESISVCGFSWDEV